MTISCSRQSLEAPHFFVEIEKCVRVRAWGNLKLKYSHRPSSSGVYEVRNSDGKFGREKSDLLKLTFKFFYTLSGEPVTWIH